MLPNHFVILWDNQPVGMEEGGYPFKVNDPGMVKYWRSREDAQMYWDILTSHQSGRDQYGHYQIVEVQFNIVRVAPA